MCDQQKFLVKLPEFVNLLRKTEIDSQLDRLALQPYFKYRPARLAGIDSWASSFFTNSGSGRLFT
jgi:hypothetical protein